MFELSNTNLNSLYNLLDAGMSFNEAEDVIKSMGKYGEIRVVAVCRLTLEGVRVARKLIESDGGN